MVELGEWVLREACKQLAAWRELGFCDLQISVNSSPQQYHRANLTSLVREVLTGLKIPPKCLFLELTEGQAMQDIDRTVATLAELREIGIGISLDDFGTGYSSLSYLRRLPITVLKIAREFVADISNGRQEATIAATILHLAHSLDLKVVAEGVEEISDLQFMVDHGCDAVQGWVFFKPMPADELTALLADPPDLNVPVAGDSERADTPSPVAPFPAIRPPVVDTPAPAAIAPEPKRLTAPWSVVNEH